ncbi:MAG: HAD family hydrolase [Alphaproteobacteria bacterium]|nr:HAD family hydrolase [Alphaproteobacteria bacterium]
MTLPAPRAVLFDWDGTLVDTWGAIHAALVGTFAAHGLEPWTFDQTKTRLNALRQHFPILFGETWRDALVEYRERYYATHLDNLVPLPGAQDLLDWVAGQGVLAAVVSNKQGDGLRRESAHLGWTPRFHRLIGSGDVARDKPDPAPVLAALAGSGLAPGPNVWLIGDTDVDMAAAAATGCTAVFVGPSPPDTPHALAAPDCVSLLATLSHFPPPLAGGAGEG